MRIYPFQALVIGSLRPAAYTGYNYAQDRLVLPGSLQRMYPEPHQIGVEQFLEMLRFDQRPKLEELSKIRM